MENYLEILEDSLRQKIAVLDEILDLDEKQEQLLKQEKLPLESFDKLVDEKDVLAEKLTKLDDGFETLYARVKNQLQDHKEAYRDRIVAMQKLIAEITEKTVSIQAKEERNKNLLTTQLAGLRQDLNRNRRNSRAAYDYYKNMSNTNAVRAQFLDQKQ